MDAEIMKLLKLMIPYIEKGIETYFPYPCDIKERKYRQLERLKEVVENC